MSRMPTLNSRGAVPATMVLLGRKAYCKLEPELTTGDTEDTGNFQFPPGTLLRDRRLVAHRLPVPAAAHPHAGVAIRAAEVFAKLVTFHIGAGGYDGGVAVEPHHHVAYINRVIADLAALAGGNCVLLGGDLAERRNSHVVFGERALGEVVVALQAGLAGLAFHVNDFANRGLVGGVERGPGMNRHVLGGEGRPRHEDGPQ